MSKSKWLKEKKELYELNIKSIETWHQDAGLENRKLIRRWASAKTELRDLSRELKEKKLEIAEELQSRKNEGEKITDKFLTVFVDGNEEVQDIRQRRDELEVVVDELYQVMLLFRDMWNASPSIRQEATMLMRHELMHE